ncbi:pyrroloquinoline quinone biosynthesis protein C, partial [Pseudoalteromonas sp. SIMBA_153]
QERMLEILQFKLDILWTILDALSLAYVHDQAPYQSVTTDHVWHKGLFK